MDIQFTNKAYQSKAVKAVVDCFAGQPKLSGDKYTIDPGQVGGITGETLGDTAELAEGVSNSELRLTPNKILENIQQVQQAQDLPVASQLVASKISRINLEVEMETGTGKTYVYIKTMFELYEQYGWSKFIIVVPSIAIREGVYQSFELTRKHFQEQYKKQIRVFIYNSKNPQALASYASDPNINCMIINMQAFNVRGKDARKIYEELDSFNTRKPIDLIKATKPIVIIDEPQKINSDPKKETKTFQSLDEFKPLFVVAYSATHKVIHNKVYRLDALDAYNQKLVKKIQVRGISVRGLSGTNGYLYLQDILIAKDKPPRAKMEIEVQQKSGIVRKTLNLFTNDDLYDKSNNLEQYKGLKIAEINPHTNSVEFTPVEFAPIGEKLYCGEATGHTDEKTLRRLQIKEAIKAHLDKEKELFNKGIKVLSLFFIDEVRKYRVYNNNESSNGEYADYFEEAYKEAVRELEDLYNPEYSKYLQSIKARDTHNGYFSIDKNKKFINSAIKKSGEEKGQSDDVSAYDLILKDKKKLLSFEEPTRFIFSHSALREGWDNPNVFVICALKKVDGSNETSRRQEIGRGLRISVDKNGNRMDDLETVHQNNVLTVVANESFTEYVKALQQDIRDSLSERPSKANKEYFAGKLIQTPKGQVEITETQAQDIEDYLLKNDYIASDRKITPKYHEELKNKTLAPLPDELDKLKPFNEEIIKLINSVFNEETLKEIASDDRNTKSNPRNDDNFYKKEFQELWKNINRKAIYSVKYDSVELINKCIKELNKQLDVKRLTYNIETGEFKINEAKSPSSIETKSDSNPVTTHVKYDVIGKITEKTGLTRKTVSKILKGITLEKFKKFKENPEDFLSKVSELIREQKATTVIEHLIYNATSATHKVENIFTINDENTNFKNALKVNNHIYDYVQWDSKTERTFVEKLDSAKEDGVVVYAKLPKKFFITTPVGNYTPDWAIAFKEGNRQHIYFIAETKGTMASMQLTKFEEIKIQCAEKYFEEISNHNVVYEKIDNYEKLIELVNR